MRVLYISRGYPPHSVWGGVANYVHIMAHAMADAGLDVHVLNVVTTGTVLDYDDRGVTVHRRRWRRLRGMRRLSLLIRLNESYERWSHARSVAYFLSGLKLAFDVVEVPDWRGEGLFLQHQDLGLVVTQVHTPLAIQGPWFSQIGLVDRNLAERMEAAAMRRSSFTISPGMALSKQLIHLGLIDPGRVVTLPLPVAIPQPESLVPVCRTDPVVFFAGALTPRKNPEVLIRAAPAIITAVPRARLVLAGPGDPRRLRDLAFAEGVAEHVEFLGQLSLTATSRLRAAARVCVIPSHFESFGYSLVEAMAAGRPVVAASTGTMSEIVQDGTTGVLLPTDDPSAWARAIVRLLTETEVAERMGAAARRFAEEKLAPDRVAAMRIRLFEALKTGRSPVEQFRYQD